MQRLGRWGVLRKFLILLRAREMIGSNAVMFRLQSHCLTNYCFTS